MTRRSYQAIELLCLAALVFFILLLCIINAGGTKKDIQEVAAPVVSAMEEGQMVQQTNADAVKAFGLDLSQTDGIVYYANDNIMDVSELLIVKLRDKEDASALKEAIEARVSDRMNLYKSYAPEQYSLLDKCTISVSGNTVFYCTAKNADLLYTAYKKAL